MGRCVDRVHEVNENTKGIIQYKNNNEYNKSRNNMKKIKMGT